MATIGALPPPPGDSANFVDPPTRTKSTIALHTVYLTVVTFCVVLRIYTRRFISHSLGWDDCETSLPFINVVTLTFHRLLFVRLRKSFYCFYITFGRPIVLLGPYDRILGPFNLEYVCPLKSQPDASQRRFSDPIMQAMHAGLAAICGIYRPSNSPVL